MATILIVDDRPTNRQMLVTLLGYGGHRLLEASDGTEALTVAEAEQPGLIISDIVMPTMDGYEFVRQLRSKPAIAHTKVIFYTASDRKPEAQKLARACGVEHVIVKPAEPKEILGVIEEALAKPSLSPAPQPAGEFDRDHRRLLTDNLARKVNELEAANAELKAAQDQLRLQAGALEAAADGVIISDQKGRIVWVNRAFCDLTGYTLGEVAGRNPRFLKSGKHDESFYRNLWETILAGRVWQGEMVNRRKDGSLYPESMTITPLVDAQGQVTHFIAIKQDITERTRAEEEIRKLNAELEERVRERTAELESANKELEAFAYSISHDLRAPLRAIHGFSHSVLEDYGPQLPSEGQQDLQSVCESAERMGQLIDDLLKFSRLSRQPLSTQTVDATALVRAVWEELRREEPGRRVELRLGKLPSCQADRSLLKQVWTNLLKYSRKRGPGRD